MTDKNDALVAQEWQIILEKDDRTSPEEYPDMALITFDEFAAAFTSLRDQLARVEAERDAALEALRDLQSVATAVGAQTGRQWSLLALARASALLTKQAKPDA